MSLETNDDYLGGDEAQQGPLSNAPLSVLRASGASSAAPHGTLHIGELDDDDNFAELAQADPGFEPDAADEEDSAELARQDDAIDAARAQVEQADPRLRLRLRGGVPWQAAAAVQQAGSVAAASSGHPSKAAGVMIGWLGVAAKQSHLDQLLRQGAKAAEAAQLAGLNHHRIEVAEATEADGALEAMHERRFEDAGAQARQRHSGDSLAAQQHAALQDGYSEGADFLQVRSSFVPSMHTAQSQGCGDRCCACVFSAWQPCASRVALGLRGPCCLPGIRVSGH
jgi:hypothetical protein